MVLGAYSIIPATVLGDLHVAMLTAYLFVLILPYLLAAF